MDNKHFAISDKNGKKHFAISDKSFTFSLKIKRLRDYKHSKKTLHQKIFCRDDLAIEANDIADTFLPQHITTNCIITKKMAVEKDGLQAASLPYR